MRIRYGGEPLGKDDALRIKSHPAFNDLVVTATAGADNAVERRAHLTDGEIFDLYYKYRRNDAPSVELKSAFIQLMGELKNEADQT